MHVNFLNFTIHDLGLTYSQHAVEHVPDLHLDGGLERPGEEADTGEDGGVQGKRALLRLTLLQGQCLPTQFIHLLHNFPNFQIKIYKK